MTPEEFDACFDRFAVSAWRLEALQRYAIDEEDERIRAWRDGLPRPERSVRNSPWLRRVAVSTAAGKQWGRAHVVDYPLSDYVRYLIGGGSYAETSAAGEEIRIADRAADPGPDFWLFDDVTADAAAILMSYDDAGHWLGAEYTTDPATISKCREVKSLAMAASVPLNVYLVRIGADALRCR
jgi:hypothetical protein